MMDRRTFVLVCAVGALSAPFAAQAQQAAGKVYRLGILSPGGAPGASAPSLPNLIPTALRELSYVEGQNLVVERRFADDHFDRLPGLARELVQLRPDVIVAISSQVIQAVRDATATIPIVMVISTDPVAKGLVASFSRPGGNVTGITTVAETSLAGKRLELLKEALPRAGRIAVLASGPIASSDQMKEAQKAGEALRVKVVPVEVRDADYDRAFSTIVAGRADAILVLMGPTFVRDRAQIIERAAKHHLPAVSSSPELVEVGGLMSYGNSTRDSALRAAAYVDRIFKGASPSNLPVEQPTKFDLVINLKTAKVLGLTLPSSLVKRADAVIQ